MAGYKPNLNSQGSLQHRIVTGTKFLSLDCSYLKTFASSTFAQNFRKTGDYKGIQNNVHGRSCPRIFMEKMSKTR